MSIINLTVEEKNALGRLSADELRKRIAAAIDEEQAVPLYGLQLSSCGSYVAQQYTNFQRDLTAYRLAKSGRKREETGDRIRRSAYRLSTAVGQMQRRMEIEVEEGQFFFVDDDVMQPFSLTDRLHIVVRYRWRKAVNDDWNERSIAFNHTIRSRPVYGMPPKRKLSAAKQREQEESNRYDTWKRLRTGALQHVQEYFRTGKDPAAIPLSFDVKTDGQGCLNNFSTKFWQDEP